MDHSLIREVSLHRAEECPAEIHLRRLTVEEALFRLDKYLNDAFLAGLPTVKVIHGKGTGTLRQAVREELKGHPLVKSFRPAELEEGGDGATIVELANQ
jgi:DNA mismatch repair protein MutS2